MHVTDPDGNNLHPSPVSLLSPLYSNEAPHAWEPDNETITLDSQTQEVDDMMTEEVVQQRSLNPVRWVCSTLMKALHAMVSWQAIRMSPKGCHVCQAPTLSDCLQHEEQLICNESGYSGLMGREGMHCICGSLMCVH
jgi:hypothetical protein